MLQHKKGPKNWKDRLANLIQKINKRGYFFQI